MFYYDSSMILLVPAIILTIYAQFKISSAYSKYSKINSIKGITGEQAAISILRDNGIYDIDVEVVSGKMTDHFDPAAKKIRLSKDVFYGTSIASVGIAAHEVGHAIQHNVGYAPIILRNKIVPIANFGASFSWGLFFLGLILSIKPLLVFGVILFSLTVLFQIVTLPVELNASNRAIKSIINLNLLYDNNEVKGAREVLNCAALTYIAATLMAIMQLIRLISLVSRRD